MFMFVYTRVATARVQMQTASSLPAPSGLSFIPEETAILTPTPVINLLCLFSTFM